jgi:hypothetical protein
MEDTANVQKDTVALLMELCRSTFGDKIKAYYEGEPIDIPKDNFPAIVLYKVSESVDLGATMTDEYYETIMISIVLNKADEIGASPDTDLSERKLRRMVGARATDGSYLPGTMLYGLRTFYTQNGRILKSDVRIEYDILPMDEQYIRSQANITLSLRQRVFVTNRT